MKKTLLFVLLFLIPFFVFAQFAVVSTQPANNTKNVPLQTTISITFNEAIDTNAMKSYQNQSNFASFDSVVVDGFSADAKTYFANVVLKPNRPYFVAFLIMKAKSGATITTPYVFYFTTGADFPPYSISGTISSGSTGVLPEGSVVGIANVNIMNDEGKDGPPPFVGWTNVNSNGTYTVPYLPNGTYWPIAVKDVDHDGSIDPNKGYDVMAFADSIVINNASITNLNMTFLNFKPTVFSESISIADSLAKNLAADRVLRRISGWDVDTLGRSPSWEYAYTYNNSTNGQAIQVRSSGSETYFLDQNYIDWIKQLKPVTNFQSAASSAVVVANAENAGGRAFRSEPHPDSLELRIELSIADQKFGWFGQNGYDTSKIYWAVAYTLQYQVSENQTSWVKGKFFLCDLATGAIVLTYTLGVKDETAVPEQFSLSQNYPNPFNPATTIEFTVPKDGRARLTIFNSIGQEVSTLFDDIAVAGIQYQKRFTASHLSSGLYVARLTYDGKQRMKKMMLLK